MYNFINPVHWRLDSPLKVLFHGFQSNHAMFLCVSCQIQRQTWKTICAVIQEIYHLVHNRSLEPYEALWQLRQLICVNRKHDKNKMCTKRNYAEPNVPWTESIILSWLHSLTPCFDSHHWSFSINASFCQICQNCIRAVVHTSCLMPSHLSYLGKC